MREGVFHGILSNAKVKYAVLLSEGLFSMGVDNEPNEREEQIVDLPDEGGDAGKGISQASWLRWPRRRKTRLIVFIALVCAAVLIVLDNLQAAWGLVARIVPPPTPPPAAEQFYVLGDPPWGQLEIDGRPVAHLPELAVETPLRLLPGRHTLQWRAPPFVTQSCITSVPADFSRDTCIDNDVVTVGESRDVRIITFLTSLNNLPADQRAALTRATQAALDGQQSTAIVRPGEDYALSNSCPQAQPQVPQIALCYAVARQPLKAVLSFQLDVNAAANLPCNSPEPQGACAFSSQNCHLFCSTSYDPAAWVVGTAVRATWTFTTLHGQVVARNVPDNPSQEDFVLEQITWDRAGWHVTPLFGGFNGSLPPFGYPTCQPLESNLNYLADAGSGPWQWNFAASASLADGCVAEATLVQPGPSATPASHRAYFLYRFGVILAGNSAARGSDWASMPAADAYEQSLVHRDIP